MRWCLVYHYSICLLYQNLTLLKVVAITQACPRFLKNKRSIPRSYDQWTLWISSLLSKVLTEVPPYTTKYHTRCALPDARWKSLTERDQYFIGLVLPSSCSFNETHLNCMLQTLAPRVYFHPWSSSVSTGGNISFPGYTFTAAGCSPSSSANLTGWCLRIILLFGAAMWAK